MHMKVIQLDTFLVEFKTARTWYYHYYNTNRKLEARKAIVNELFSAIDLGYAYEEFIPSAGKLLDFLAEAVFDAIKRRYIANPRGFVGSISKLVFHELQYYLPIVSDEDFKVLVDKSQSFLTELESYHGISI